MIDVFRDPRFAIQYEQINLDLGDSYGRFATSLIDLVKIPPESRVLDLASGTGISTCRLIDIVPNVRVAGIDKSKPFLEMALLKFGYTEPNAVFKRILEEHPYPQILRKHCEVKDLDAHLREAIGRYKAHKGRVALYERDASQFSDIPEERFSFIIASQFIHWARKRGVEPGMPPNLEYERKVIQEVRSMLNDGGLFAFNTTGADYFFNEPDMDEIHMYMHPFYKSFIDSVKSQLSIASHLKSAYTFTHQEIGRVMEENGFAIENIKKMKLYFTPDNFKEICLIGGQMQIFQKLGIDLSMKQREEILAEALQYAMSRHPLDTRAKFIETGVHYAVRKK